MEDANDRWVAIRPSEGKAFKRYWHFIWPQSSFMSSFPTSRFFVITILVSVSLPSARARISSPAPNKHARSSPSTLDPETSKVTFSAYPADPSDEQDVNKTNVFLGHFFGRRMVQGHDANGNVFWTIALKEGESFARFRRYERLVLPEEHKRLRLKAVAETKREQVAKDEPSLQYMAAPKDPENAEEVARTRAFLYSKVAANSPISEVKLGNKLQLWGRLTLDADAKADVEQYPGIRAPLSEDRKLLPC